MLPFPSGVNARNSPTDYKGLLLLGIIHLSPHNEVVYLTYIAVANNTSSREGEEPLRRTEANTVV